MKNKLHEKPSLLLWLETRMAFENRPEIPAMTVSATTPEAEETPPQRIQIPEVKIAVTAKEVAKQREQLNMMLKKYERRREELLKVIDHYKTNEDPDSRIRAVQYENRVLNETIDPSVLRALRNLTIEEVQKNIEKLTEIASSTIERDELLTAWFEAREKEKTDQLVKRYNYLREVNIAILNSLKPYFGSRVLFEKIMSDFNNSFPALNSDEVKDSKSALAIISELEKAISKIQPQMDMARNERHKLYEKAFYHAIGRAHDRDLSTIESNPADFERKVSEMVNRIKQVNLDEVEAGDSWTVTYEGLTFSITRGKDGMNVKLIGASEENLARYVKLSDFLGKQNKDRQKTAAKPSATNNNLDATL
jgi:hypothetical protein